MQVVPRVPTPNTAVVHRVSAPVASIPVQTTLTTPTVATASVPQQVIAGTAPGTASTVTIPTYAVTGGVAAQGYINDPVPPPPVPTLKPSTLPSSSKSKSASKKKQVKKNQPVLPKAEQPPGNLPTIMPKVQVAATQSQILQNQPVIQNVQFPTQEVVYQTVDQQNPENKVLVKTLLAQKIRTGNVIIQQPIQGVVNVQNVELGASSDSQPQTIQYQTSFPQNVQQTTYFQYAAPTSSTQTIIQSNQPTSQVQTFVVQPGGEMYSVQGQLPSSSLSTQQQLITQQQIVVSQQPMVVSQQPMVVSQQPMVVSQQPIMVTQQPVVMSQQPQQQFISQPQVITQSHILPNSQFIPQQQTVVPTSQVLLHPQSSQLPSQNTVSTSFSSSSSCTSVSSTDSLPSTVSSVVLPSTLSASSSAPSSEQVTTTNSSIPDSCDSASQVILHSKEESSVSGDNSVDNGSGNVHMVKDLGTEESDMAESSNEQSSVSKPSSFENENNSAFSVSDSVVNSLETKTKVEMATSVEVSAEIESAVGSIMEESNDTDTPDDEPVMIENDGNELMFEQQKYQHTDDGVNPTTEIYGGDEAAMAVEQLEQMEQDEEVDNGVLVISDSVQDNNDPCDNVEESMEVSEDTVNTGEEIMSEQTMEICADDVEYKEGSVEKETQMSDEELIAKFRAETPINVPLVSENGLLEQDFEARMAVENLLKDVEFKVNDDDSSEMNIIFACQRQETAGNSLKVQETGEDSAEPVVDSTCVKDTEQPESQNSKPAIINHNGTAVTSAKPLNTVEHPVLNGIDPEHKPLMNGDLSSPECPSVPSPSLVNGGDKIVNGISDDKLVGDMEKAIVDKVLKMNGVVNHKISSSLQESKMMEVSAECTQEMTSDVDQKPRTEDILAQSMLDSNIDKSEDSLDQTDKVEHVKCEEVKADDDGDILARSILENGIQPSDCDIPDPEPASVTAVVKQIIPNTVYGNIMTVQINNNTIPITFANNALITSKNSIGSQQINVCSSRHIPTPETARDGELSCDSSSSSVATSEQLNVMVNDKHSVKATQSKLGQKESKKSLTSPKLGESKKQKASSKKRSRSKSGGSSGGNDSRPSSVSSPATASTPAAPPEFMCEWAHCRQ